MTTGGIHCDKLNASSTRENVSAATKTPLPKAIIAAIILLGRLTNNAIVHPMTKGILAINPINPHSRDSNIVCDGIALTHISYQYIIFY
ncbi:MAG TPA: hypothetical protein VE643_09120 [Nitrososphaeraceae archaeon]|nr:hypothetical protein [Nitrososphaeraceae archaeon]